ncbi:MAG: hypothetical protein AB1600_00640 [Bacteroidota bacterium]
MTANNRSVPSQDEPQQLPVQLKFLLGVIVLAVVAVLLKAIGIL